MTLDSARFGSQPFTSPVNSNTGVAIKNPGYLRELHARSTANSTYYVLFYDQPAVPPANIAATDPTLIKPVYVMEVEPAIVTVKGKGDRTVEQMRKCPYFERAISYVFSTDPTRYVSIAGQYPLTLEGSVSLGKMTGFNPDKHGINVGQEPHPSYVDDSGVVVPAGNFDLRVGGALEKACDRWQAEGRKLLRINYDPYDYSKLESWKQACLYIKSRGFDVLLGWTAISTGNITQARLDSFKTAIPNLALWAAQNGFKTVAIANEEANHMIKTATFTVASVVGQLFELSLTVRQLLDANGFTDVKLTFSSSEGERPEVTKQYQAGVPHAFNEFGFNEYDTVLNFAAHIADIYAVFGNKAVITEWGDERGVYATQNNEIEQAANYIQKRNIMDAYKMKHYVFCDVDGGVGAGVVDQWGIVRVDGHKLKAHDALLQV